METPGLCTGAQSSSGRLGSVLMHARARFLQQIVPKSRIRPREVKAEPVKGAQVPPLAMPSTWRLSFQAWKQKDKERRR